MKLIFVLLIGSIGISEQQYLRGPTKTIPEYFPYHAYIKADLYCLGALISPRFVVLHAICVESRNTASVYLGASKDPTQILMADQDFQKIKSAEIIIHPQFSKRSYKLMINNIALIKLLERAILMSTVQPVRLPAKEDFPLLPGMVLNVTGYKTGMFHSSVLRYMTVRVRKQQTCFDFYGKHILTEDERCVEGIGEERLDWTGAFTKQGRLVGLGRVVDYEADCLVVNPLCSPRDVFMTIRDYLDWIYENSDVPRYKTPPKRIMLLPRQPPPVLLQPPPPVLVQPPPPVLVQTPPPVLVSQPVVKVITNETESSDAKHPKKGAE